MKKVILLVIVLSFIVSVVNAGSEYYYIVEYNDVPNIIFKFISDNPIKAYFDTGVAGLKSSTVITRYESIDGGGTWTKGSSNLIWTISSSKDDMELRIYSLSSNHDIKYDDGTVFFSPPTPPPPLAQSAEGIPVYVGSQVMMILIASGTLLVGVLGTLLIRRLVYSYLR